MRTFGEYLQEVVGNKPSHIVVKKDEHGEWQAAWYDGNVKDDNKSYYTNGSSPEHKKDAEETAAIMRKKHGIQ